MVGTEAGRGHPRDGGRWWQAWAAALALFWVALGSSGCAPSSSHRPVDVVQARLWVDQRLAGPWRLVSFVPDAPLSPAIATLVAYESDRLVVVFERGRLRSESSTVSLDWAYRIEEPTHVPFRVVLTDEQGVSYDTLCSFDEAGRLLFQSITEPWKGRGVLQREGVGLAPAS